MVNETPKEAARRFAGPIIAEGYKPTALHAYTAANGEPLFWRIRAKHPVTGAKWIRPMYLNGEGYKLGEPAGEARRALYALDRIAATPDAVVWIVEGEGKADALNALNCAGLVATTSGGATSASGKDWEPLRGRICVIWPDNDEAGMTYAGGVARILIDMGSPVSLVDIDVLGLGEAEDAEDWLRAHPEADGAAIEALPRCIPAPATIGAARADSAPRIVVVDILDFLNREIAPRERIVSPWLLTQSLNMLYAWRGVGKTHVALGLAYAAASGGSFLTWKATRPHKVLYLDGEMPAPSMQSRLRALVASDEADFDPLNFRLVTPDLQTGRMPDLATADGQGEIDTILGDTELIFVDNLSTLARAVGKENDAESWAPIMPWALRMRQEGRSVVFVHHSGKGGQQRGTSKKEDILDCVLTLKRPPDYDPADGAVFEVHFEKARDLHGEEAAPFEARLQTDESGAAKWITSKVEDTTFDRVIGLANEGHQPNEIAQELEINKSTVSRHMKKAREAGLIKGETSHGRTH